jgi:hypothetical protein
MQTLTRQTSPSRSDDPLDSDFYSTLGIHVG